MGEGQGAGDVAGDAEGLQERQAAEAAQAGAEGLARQVLHHHVGGAARQLAALDDVDETGVADADGGARLVDEAAHVLAVGRELLVEELHGGAVAAAAVAGLVDRAHAAATDEPDHAVAADGLSEQPDRILGAAGSAGPSRRARCPG